MTTQSNAPNRGQGRVTPKGSIRVRERRAKKHLDVARFMATHVSREIAAKVAADAATVLAEVAIEKASLRAARASRRSRT